MVPQSGRGGVTDAETGLGRIYYEGEGAFRNYSEAEKWYRKGRQSELPAPLSVWASCTTSDRESPGTTRRPSSGTQSRGCRIAAAVANIGILYYNAQGVKRDLVEAYVWFSHAPRSWEIPVPKS